MTVMHDPVRLPVGGNLIRNKRNDDRGLAVIKPPLSLGQATILGCFTIGCVVQGIFFIMFLTMAMSTEESDPAGFAA